MAHKVIVFGGSGMLGSMVADVLSRDPSFSVTATARNRALIDRLHTRAPEVNWVEFDIEKEEWPRSFFCRDSWIINAIGVTKPYIVDTRRETIARAVKVNVAFPLELANCAEYYDANVLQIATDCVFSGRNGPYTEDAEHDALDTYGKTKSLGEVCSPNVRHLRASIIGPEPRGYRYLLEWFCHQPRDAKVGGYIDHYWNGITTLAFARICHGMITSDACTPHVQHIVPQDQLSKRDLLRIFSVYFKRDDIVVACTPTDDPVNRVLATQNIDLNVQLWQAAGYDVPPMLSELVAELAAFDYRFARIDQ